MTLRITSFWARFARVSTGRFVPEVDGLRFLAIGAVLAVHVLIVLVAPVVVAVSGALFLALEKPFMRPDWHRTRFGRRKENSAPRAETLSFQMDEGR